MTSRARARCQTTTITILGRFLVLLVVHDVKVEAEQIDGDGVLARKVLLHARQEGLREEEARHPELRRRSVVEPVLW